MSVKDFIAGETVAWNVLAPFAVIHRSTCSSFIQGEDLVIGIELEVTTMDNNFLFSFEDLLLSVDGDILTSFHEELLELILLVVSK